MKKLPMWLNCTVLLGSVVGAAWAADARWFDEHRIKTLDESIQQNALAIQMHARDDISLRTLQLEARDNLTEPERRELLFYKQKLQNIDQLIERLE